MLRACRKRETDLSEAQLYIAPFLSAPFRSARLPADKRESIAFVPELLAYIYRADLARSEFSYPKFHALRVPSESCSLKKLAARLMLII